MKNKKNTKGFTLVELIVVITILVILGTISFISFQGLSADARDTKRGSDISNITNAMEISMIKGVNLTSFVDGTGSMITDTTTGSLTKLRISGEEGYTALSGSYFGGDINYTVLGLNKSDFSDPLKITEAYKIGVTNKSGNFYEVAATIENKGATDTLVNGTWNPRLGSISYSGTQGTDTFSLSGILITNTNLRIRDIVRFNAGVTSADKYSIIGITGGNLIQLDRPITSLGSVIFLNSDETRHLIKKRGTGTGNNSAIDVGAGEFFTPYKLN